MYKRGRVEINPSPNPIVIIFPIVKATKLIMNTIRLKINLKSFGLRAFA